MMTFEKFQPYFRDFGFLDLPPLRARIVTGTSAILRAVTERLDQDLARPELILLEHQVAEQVGTRGAVAARDVGDAGAGEDRHDAREEVHAQMADRALLLELAEQARAVHVVGLAADDGADHHVEFLRQVLAVGVERHDDVGAHP